MPQIRSLEAVPSGKVSLKKYALLPSILTEPRGEYQILRAADGEPDDESTV